MCLYIHHKKKKNQKTGRKHLDGVLVDVWLLPQIQCNNTITFITRKIFSRWLWSVPSNLTSGKCGWDQVNRMLLRRVLFVSLAIRRPSLPWCTEPGSRIRAFPASARMRPCPDSALKASRYWDRWFLWRLGCIVSATVEGLRCYPLHRYVLCVCDRSSWHGGRRRQFFLDLYNRVSSQRDATELAPHTQPWSDTIENWWNLGVDYLP